MLDYVRQLFSLVFALSIQYTLLGCEIKSKSKLYLIWIYSASVLAFDSYFLIVHGYASFMKFYPLLVNFTVFMGFVFVSKFKPLKVLFVNLTVIAIAVSVTTIGLVVSYFFDGNTTVVNLISYVLYLPAWILIYRYLRPSLLYMMENTEKGWLGFCVIPLTYCMLVYSVSLYNLDAIVIGRIIRNVVLFFIMGFSAYYMIFRIFKQSREQIMLQSEQNLLKVQLATAKTHFESLKESQESITIYRHDMHHHLNLIHSYLADNNVDVAQKYVEEVEKRIERSAIEKYSNNYTLNLILSSYIAKAKEEQIRVESKIELLENNPVSDMDLCIIFANAIENATNACKKIPDPKKRFIKITAKVENGKSQIQITNTFMGSVDFLNDMPVSTRENHGIGTKSIAAVVNKYAGIYSFAAEKEIFKMSIIV